MKKERILNSPITVTALPEAAEAVLVNAGKGESAYVCLANVHMLVMGARNRDLQKVMEEAAWVLPDGLPLTWLLKRRGFAQAERIPGTDLTLKVCETAAGEGISVGFYGTTSETLESLRKSLLHRFPRLNITFCESPPLLPEKPEGDPHVVGRLNRSGAKIVFVGLGCPKQEFWMAAHSPHVPAVLIGVGAAFDFIAGTIRRAPLWMQKGGLEWFYRLCREPRRLWRRYLVGNALFVWMVTKEIINKKHRV
jgi:N-acetylglucosaminyldiphosphoundecaprenol N-acetyl-beta-D-mannosaminyltransferase